MTRFSPFFLLMGGLVLSLQAQAQAGPPVVGNSVGMGVLAVATPAPHSSQLPHEELPSVPVFTASNGSPAAAAAASKSQLLLVLLETIQAQQARLDALQTETEAAIRRANQAEAATVAFEQRLRQLEAASNRPSFWR